MKKTIQRIVIFLCVTSSFAQNHSLLNSVMAWAEADTAKKTLTLKWKKQANDSSFVIFRKLKDARSWPVIPLATLPRTATEFKDSTIKIGSAYEYKIRRKAERIFSESYLYGGVKVNAVELKKTILLMVDDRIRTGILPELNTLKEDLANETWNVKELIVPQNKTALEVKDMLWEVYDSNPELTTIFIIGHVPVPYSGNTQWDGHPDHNGAWVCDNFYADINGFWTDEFVNNTSPARAENKNIIGDEKWDNDLIPSDLEFEVGRVDFFNMPALIKSETQLLKNYLNKDHLHRIGKTRAVRRAIVQDNFNFANEFFGSSGYKNYTVLVGPDSVKTEAFRDQLTKNSYLLAYGAGGGWYQGAGGISTTPDMAKDSLQAVFTFLFGSYFGDWDVQDNFLRSSLASGTILTSAWAGRPSWYIQHMSMGETIGYSTFVTNNNQTIYSGNPSFSSYRPAHVSLLGDPSLTLLPVIPPKDLTAIDLGGTVSLNWTGSVEASEGYTIMRRTMPDGKFMIIANNVRTTNYLDKCLDKDLTFEYLVAAVKLETNASGSFFNRSAGTRSIVEVKKSNKTVASISHIADYEFITARSTSNGLTNQWVVNGQRYPGDTLKITLPCTPKNQKIKLISQGECNVDSTEINLDVKCSTPELLKYSFRPEIKCFNDLTDIYLDTIDGAGPFSFLWSNGATTNPVKNVKGTVSVQITSSKDTKKSFDIKLPQYDQIIISDIQVKNVNQGFNLGSVRNVLASGGVPPYTYKVLNVIKQDSLPVGNYTLELTDANGCKSIKTFEIKLNVFTQNPNQTDVQIYPNPVRDELFIQTHEELGTVQIINLKGELIENPKLEKTADKQVYKIKVQHLVPGYYYIKSSGKKGNLGFVKE